MTARGPGIGALTLTEYVRLFRVSSATTIVLNGALHMAQDSCDTVIAVVGEEDSDEQDKWRDACGGEDYFSVPSKDGTPFQIYIRYPGRQRTGPGILYFGRPDARVFGSNLFGSNCYLQSEESTIRDRQCCYFRYFRRDVH
jgi:hypothetical protein